MRAAHKIIAHQGVLRAERFGIDLVEHLAAPVAISVSGRGRKMAFAHTGRNEGGQHLLLVVVRCIVDAFQDGGNFFHRAGCRVLDA